jgi:hypothetical protein
MSDGELREKLGVLIAKVDAAHHRIDKNEAGTREDLKEIFEQLKALNAHMNRGKGWAGAMFFLSGIAGAGVIKLLSVAFGK